MKREKFTWCIIEHKAYMQFIMRNIHIYFFKVKVLFIFFEPHAVNVVELLHDISCDFQELEVFVIALLHKSDGKSKFANFPANETTSFHIFHILLEVFLTVRKMF